MNWRTPLILLGVVVLLLGFILLVERRAWRVSQPAREQARRLVSLKPEELTSVQIRRAAELLLRVDQTNGQWMVTFPIRYPAQGISIAALAIELSRLESGSFMTLEELEKRQQTVADFGLDVPVATLILLHEGKRTEVRFGVKTAVGDRVYIQVQDSPNIYVVPGSVYDRLPRSPNDWRDPALVDLDRMLWDRVEIRTAARTLGIQRDLTNRTYVLFKPTPGRADGPKVESLLRVLDGTRILQFVEDNPRGDLDVYGLQNPRAELVVGWGTNDQMVVQFGKNPTNDPGAVYALSRGLTNVVLVSQGLLDQLQVSHADLREKRLFSFLPGLVDSVEIVGVTNLVVQRQPGQGWAAVEPQGLAVDADLMKYLFERLGSLEGELERDLVSDFSAYGLAAPQLQYYLRSAVTNGAGGVTNRLLGRLDFGARQEEKVFVRRGDEPSVYSIPYGTFAELAREAWQLRDRRVWVFSTNDVMRVRVRLPDREVTLIRTGPGRWELAPGSQGIINDLAVEESLFRLGELKADYWVARGEDQRARFGLATPAYSIQVELKGPEGAPTVRTVEFGQSGRNQFPLALAEVDGQALIFEFPKKLYFEVVRDLIRPFWKAGKDPLP